MSCVKEAKMRSGSLRCCVGDALCCQGAVTKIVGVCGPVAPEPSEKYSRASATLWRIVFPYLRSRDHLAYLLYSYIPFIV